MSGVFNNAIGWVQLQLRGGWRNVASLTLGYGVIMAVLIILTTRLEPLRAPQILGAWTMGLLVLEAAILLFLGCATIGKAIRRDLSGDMILSHRLMPMAPAEAVFGYILGPGIQPLALGLATLALSFLTASSTGTPLELWLLPHLILLTFSAFTWVCVAFASFALQGGAGWMAAIVFGGWLGQGLIFEALPGLMVLATPLLGRTIFSMRNTSLQLGSEYVVSIAAQVLIGILLFRGAMRRYRRSDVAALGTGLGLALLAAWVGVSLCGMIYWNQYQPVWAGADLGATVPFLSTLGLSTLLAIAPVTHAGQQHDHWRMRRTSGDPVLGRRPVPMVLVLIAALALVLALTYAAPRTHAPFPSALLRTAVVVGAMLVTGVYFVRTLERRGIKAWRWLMVLHLFVTAGPLLYDTISGALAGGREVAFSMVSTLSPLGAMIQVWSVEQIDPLLGLAAQSATAMVMVVIHQLTRPRPVPSV